MLPITLPIAEDEDLRGYLIRNAEKCLMDKEYAIKHCLGYRNYSKYNFIKKMALLSENNLLPHKMAIEEILFKHSPLMVNTILMSEARMAKLMDILLYDAPSDYLTYPINGNRFKYCPECVKEDISTYHEPIVHAPHQIRWMNACYKHGNILVDDPGKTSDISTENEIKISHFLYDLYEKGTYGSYEKVIDILKENNKTTWTYASIKTILYDFSSYKLLTDKLPRMEEGRKPFIKYRCQKCNTELLRCEISVNRRVICPVCAKNMSLKKRVINDVTSFVPEEFELNDIKNYKKIELTHKPCGTIISRNVMSILKKTKLVCPRCSKHIGEEKIMNAGITGRIIEYRNYQDIDVVFENGEEVRHVNYGDFIHGKVYPNNSYVDYKRQTYVGEEKTMNCGMKAKITAYRNCHDIDVQFENGYVRKNVNYTYFQKGFLIPGENTNDYIRNLRLGEETITNGGQKATIIDYRCSDDIDVQLDDGQIVTTSYEYFKKGVEIGGLKKAYRKKRVGETRTMKNGRIATIIEYRNCKDIDVEFENGTIREHIKYESFKSGALTGNKVVDLVGVEKTMNCGLKAKIIAYRNCQDIDVQFENGYIRKNVTMKRFNKRTILPAESKKDYYRSLHLGEEIITKGGQKARIIDYLNNDSIDVELESGSVVRTSYKSFKSGYVGGLNNTSLIHGERIGEEKTMKDGHTARIIDYRNAGDIDVEFDNGSIRRNVRYEEFRKGSIYRNGRSAFGRRLGEEGIMNDGHKARIIVYRNCDDIDIKFDNGYIKSHSTYQAFLKGEIRCSKVSDAFREKRIGEEQIMKNGIKAKIIEYRGSNDIDVKFENGKVKEHTNYLKFKRGELMCNTKAEEYRKKRLGEERVMNNGMKAKIIEYRKCDDIDVKFENGKIKEHTTYASFKVGKLLGNRVSETYREKRLGEERTMKNGMVAKIVNYCNTRDIDVQFEDNTIATHKRYSSFVQGTLKPVKNS